MRCRVTHGARGLLLVLAGYVFPHVLGFFRTLRATPEPWPDYEARHEAAMAWVADRAEAELRASRS